MLDISSEIQPLPTFHVELPALVVEAVRDLVADDPPDSAVVHVLGPVVGEEYALNQQTKRLQKCG